MLYERFIGNLERTLSNQFEILKDADARNLGFDLFARFADQKVRTFLTESDIIDKYENTEYFVVKRLDSSDLNVVEEFVNQLRTFLDKNAKPSEHHMSTVVNAIVFCPRESDLLKAWVKKFKYTRIYKFYLYGWSELRLCVVFEDSGEIVVGRNSTSLKKLVRKIISKIEEVEE